MAGSARLSANQSICTISIEIAQPAMTNFSSRVKPVAAVPSPAAIGQGAVYAVFTVVKNSAA